LSKTKWVSPDLETIRVDYYFADKASLQEFRTDELHRAAKQRYAEWYVGYRVEISEIIHSYSDGNLS
jgi:hypothetical protein